jgi:hypothetical protein
MAHGQKNMVPHLTTSLTGALVGVAKDILDSMPAIETGCQTPDCADDPNAPPNRFRIFGVVARLAMPDREKMAQSADAPQ